MSINELVKKSEEDFTDIPIESFSCWNCNSEIIIYFNKKYKGKRGNCIGCGVDFPLD